MRSDSVVVSLKGTRLRETDKAVQFCISDISGTILGQETTTWFPNSQIKSSTTGTNVGEDVLVVSEWIMEQKELI